jgi:amidohydrolase
MSASRTVAPVEEWLRIHGPELVAVRRHLHARPELSGEEHETTRLVADRLAGAGLVPRPLASGTGLWCDLGSGPGPVIALRADLDALAMQDEKRDEPRSTRDGVAHACGHDVHTAIVLGAGLHLAGRADDLDGRVRLVFQPAEERLPGGALDVIADGGLDDVDVIYGLHCEPKLPVGSIGLRVGAITSATDSLTIELAGPGGHTARPELTVDLIDLVGRIVTGLPDRVRARLGDDVPLKLVFGAVRAGDAPNVIPSRATLKAVARTTSEAVWSALPTVLDDAVADIVADDGVTATVTHTRGVPPVVNDPDAVAVAERTVVRTWGADAVEPAPQSWGGDDFAWYTQRVPGAYLRLGTHDTDAGGPMLDLHAGLFDVDERAIDVGVELLVGIVEEELRSRQGLRS